MPNNIDLLLFFYLLNHIEKRGIKNQNYNRTGFYTYLYSCLYHCRFRCFVLWYGFKLLSSVLQFHSEGVLLLQGRSVSNELYHLSFTWEYLNFFLSFEGQFCHM